MLRIFFSFFVFLFLSGSPFSRLPGQADTARANALFSEGKDRYYDGDYEKARRPLEQALAIRREWYGPEHPAVLEVLLRLGKNEQQLRNYPSGIRLFEEGLAIAERSQGPESELTADFLLELGHTYSQLYRPREADEYYRRCMAVLEKIYGADSPEVGNMYMNFGISAVKAANYYEADRYFARAYTVFQQSSEPTSKDFYRIYSNRGYLYRKMGNYERALEFATKAMAIKLLHYPPGHPSVAKYHRNIGRIHQEKGAYKTALPFFQKTVDILEKSLGRDHPETAGSYGELANIYADLGESQKALTLYRKAVAIQEKTLPPTHPYLVGGYFNIGRVYEDLEVYEQALDYYEQALDKFHTGPYVPRNLIARTQSRMAALHFTNGHTRQALLTLQQALQQIAPGFTFDENEIYPNPALSQVQADVDFLELLQTKARFLQALSIENEDTRDLQEALHTSELAIRLIERMWRGYQSENARKFLNARTAPIYRQAVDQAFKRYEQTGQKAYLWKAFELSEKNKATILRQSLHENLALETSGIPQPVLDSIGQLHRRIADLEEQWHNPAEKERVRKNLQSQIFDLKRTYERQIEELEQHNARYYQLKHQPPTADPATLARRLPDDETALLAYFYDTAYVYIFVVAHSGIKGIRQPITFDLPQAVSALREHPAGTATGDPQAGPAYIDQLNQLHALLIEPIQEQLAGKKKLVIVPAGPLHYLSFELLAPAGPSQDFRRLDYLIKHYDLQYAWSAALWAEAPSRTGRPEQSFAGFAPGFNRNELADLPLTKNRGGGLAALLHTVPEVNEAHRYFAGDVFTGPEATESRFLQSAPHCRILHLATHAFADDRFPLQSGLLFAEDLSEKEDGVLHAFEIYNLSLRADLAVISACDTGFGPLSEGEGVMSLGRAFTYAGCKSVVMSLWPANDRSASSLIGSFYRHLSTGLPKDAALRQAKLDYLHEADPLTAHPYFWGNLIAAGDMRAIPIRSFPPDWLIWLLIPAALLLGGWLLLKRKRSGHLT